MKIAWFLFMLSLASVNFSCKKNSFHEETLSGILLHSLTKKPLPNQKISIQVTTYKTGRKQPPEWPDGIPVFKHTNYITTTDNSGRFVLNVEVEGEWMYFANLMDGEFIQKTPIKTMGFLFPGNSMILAQVKEMYDTIYAEKPGYIRYHINNTNESHTNDSLFVLTYYLNSWIRPTGGFAPAFAEYNLIFVGALVNKSITDTIPAESEPTIPIKWLYKRTDTITLKHEFINVQPGAIVDYIIAY
jgi:hypothetical protein